jgi:hypothetical protein
MELQPSQQQLFYVQPQTISTQRKIGKKVRKKEEKQRIEEAYPLAARLGVKLAEFVSFWGLMGNNYKIICVRLDLKMLAKVYFKM